MILEGLAFYLFALLAIAAGALVVTSRNPVHSVLFLIFAFFNAAGLFVLLNAEFLAMILVIVYVGAVAVLFLFVVMMLDINFRELRQGAKNYARFGLVLGVVLVAELAVIGALYDRNFSYLQVQNTVTVSPTQDPPPALAEPHDTDADATKEENNAAAQAPLEQNNTENLPLDSETSDDSRAVSPLSQNNAANEDKYDAAITNTEAIGRLLYTKYFLMFQLAGLILLVAMIGAITLSLRHRGGVRRQAIGEQLARNPANSVRLAKVQPYQAIPPSDPNSQS